MSKVRFKHFHHLVTDKKGNVRKGNIAGTMAYQDDKGQILIGLTVANPNDKVITRQRGRAEALDALSRSDLRMSFSVFNHLMSKFQIFPFLAACTGKSIKIVSRKVV